MGTAKIGPIVRSQSQIIFQKKRWIVAEPGVSNVTVGWLTGNGLPRRLNTLSAVRS